MWIEGRRRGGAKDLSKHLRKAENEKVFVRDLEGFSFAGLTGDNLDKALKQMEAIGYGKKAKRNLYHAILAPAYGETLSAAQQKFMVEYYAEHMGFSGHQYALVEHWKNGKQHFHLVFNIINPATGKIHELKWTKQKEWRISRGLEEIFGLSAPKVKGKSVPTWAMQRGKRTGVDPRKMRKEITAIFHASKTTGDFVKALNEAGYALTHGRRNQLVLVDKTGDTHGLMRRIESKRLADLRRKFPGIEKLDLPAHATLVNERKKHKPEQAFPSPESIDPQRVREDVQKAYRTSKTGAAFFAALNKRGYSLGRGLNGFSVIDGNAKEHSLIWLLGEAVTKKLGEKYPDLEALRPRPVQEIIRRIRARACNRAEKPIVSPNGLGSVASHLARQPKQRKLLDGTSSSTIIRPSLPLAKVVVATSSKTEKPRIAAPDRPEPNKKKWPEQAIIDWEVWGHRDPAKFYSKWPELAPENFVPFNGSTQPQ